MVKMDNMIVGGMRPHHQVPDQLCVERHLKLERIFYRTH
jgi:hypothetical protein